MARNTQADGGNVRHTETFDLSTASEGDRVDPALVPRDPSTDVGDSVAPYVHTDEDRTYGVRGVLFRKSGQFDDRQTALVFDPETEEFAILGGLTSSAAMNQKEADFKILTIGTEPVVSDVSDVETVDIDEPPEEFAREWVNILFGNARYGDDISDEVKKFDGKNMQLRDFDGRRASFSLEFKTEGDR